MSLLVALWIATVILAAWLGTHADRAPPLLISRLAPSGHVEIETTSLYDLEIRSIRSSAEGPYGGIAALDHGILIADPNGLLWYIDNRYSVQPLKLSIPIDRQAFEADPDNADVAEKYKLAVRDILVARLSNRLLLLASHDIWDEEKTATRCVCPIPQPQKAGQDQSIPSHRPTGKRLSNPPLPCP